MQVQAQAQAQVQSSPVQPGLQMQECPARVGVGWGELGMEMRWDGRWGCGCLRWQVKPGQVIASSIGSMYNSSPGHRWLRFSPLPVLRSSSSQVQPRSSVQRSECRPLVMLEMGHGRRAAGSDMRR